MVAAKAYDIYNTELEPFGLKINIPETIWDVSKEEIPLWVQKLGGQAVIKIPYSNAGQGVFTIINEQELEAFMAQEIEYKRFIVQSLIGNYNWSSTSSAGKFYHVGITCFAHPQPLPCISAVASLVPSLPGLYRCTVDDLDKVV